MKRHDRFKILLAAACLVVLANEDVPEARAEQPGAQAVAGALEEILVTATRVGETHLQDTPLAVSAFSAKVLEERQVGDIRSIAEFTPGLVISENAAMAQVFIRGVGSNNVYLGADSSSTVQVDGVYMARPEQYFTALLDVERIEVLRGPQGTLYGRNSVGGTINVISRRPTEQAQGKVQASYGNFGAYALSGYLSGPIVEGRLMASLAGQRRYHDAYQKNVGAGNDADDEDNFGFRGQILFAASDELEFLVRADFNKSTGVDGNFNRLLRPTGDPTDALSFKPNGKPDLGLYSTNLGQDIERQQEGISLEANYAINNELNVKALIAYRESRYDLATDADASSLNIFRTLIENDQDQLSAEVNLTGKLEKLDFVSGAYYFKEEGTSFWTVAVPGFGVNHIQRPSLVADNYALFAQGTYRLTDKFSATAGIRYTHEAKDFYIYDYWTAPVSLDREAAENGVVLVGVPGLSNPFVLDTEKKESAVTPKFGLEFRPNDDMLLYGTVTKGYKSGGFDLLAARPDYFEYDSEYLWAYEVGLKGSFLHNRVRGNLSTFLYDYKNLQVQIFTPPANTRTLNAADARVRGIELEMQARPIPDFWVFGNIAYLDATYRSFPNATVTGYGEFDAAGKRLNNAPKWQLSVGGEYTHELGNVGSLFVSSEYGWQSTRFFTAVNHGIGAQRSIELQSSYALLNARLGWTGPGGTWQVMVYGKNLTDKEYVTGTANFTANISARPGFPRTYGVTAVYNF